MFWDLSGYIHEYFVMICPYELYDHKNDPDENYNIADKPENKKLITELSKKMKNGWKSTVKR